MMKKKQSSMSSQPCKIISMEDPATYKGLIDMITIAPKETDTYERKYK